MAAANLDKALALIFGHEGGFSNRSAKDDPGGATMYGITAATLGAYRKLGRKASADEVKALTAGEAREIMASQYARPIRFDDLPAGLDYATLDFAINSGPAQAVRTLQACLGVSADGIMGAQTLAAINKANVPALILAYCDARMAFLHRLRNWKANARGWTIRVTGKDPRGLWKSQPGVIGNALKMAKGQVPRPPVVLADSGAKASPDHVAVTSTAGGKAAVGGGIGVAAAAVGQAKDAVQPLTGSGGWVDTTFAVLTIVGVLLTVGSLAWGFYQQQKQIKSGAPA